MKPSHGTFLHGRIGLDIEVRGDWTFMVKPERGDADVDAGLLQVHLLKWSHYFSSLLKLCRVCRYINRRRAGWAWRPKHATYDSPHNRAVYIIGRDSSYKFEPTISAMDSIPNIGHKSTEQLLIDISTTSQDPRQLHCAKSTFSCFMYVSARSYLRGRL